MSILYEYPGRKRKSPYRTETETGNVSKRKETLIFKHWPEDSLIELYHRRIQFHEDQIMELKQGLKKWLKKKEKNKKIS
jgi:hypothetical protein